MKVTVRVPASSANLGSGVDTLGLALSLYLTVTMENLPEGSCSEILCGNGFDGPLPDNDNYVLTAAKELFKEAGEKFPAFRMRIDTDIPFAHGLGSSSAALIGGLYGANAFLKTPLTQQQLLTIANRMEGHPDNVVPAALGGFTLAMADKEGILYHSFKAPDFTYIAAVPAYRLSTEKARKVLPNNLPLGEAVSQLQRACFLIQALQSEDSSALCRLTEDAVFTPARRPLMPGSQQACQAAMDAGAFCSFTSGAGPTMLAIAPQKSEDTHLRISTIGEAMKNAYAALDIDCYILYLNADNKGVQVSIQE